MSHIPKVNLLFLFANSDNKKRLRLREERDAIEKIFTNCLFKDLLAFNDRWDVSPDNLTDLLSHANLQLVHFSGHSEPDSFHFVNSSGTASKVSNNLLCEAFELVRNKIKVAVFNSCTSETLAQKIAGIVGCAIGFKTPIDDKTAILFSTRFYKWLAEGYSVRHAFDVTKTDLKFSDLPEAADSFILKHANNVEPDKIFLVKHLYYGNSLLHHPIIWNSFVTLVDYMKSIHHIFYKLTTFIHGIIISDLSEIKEADPKLNQKIMKLHQSWNMYSLFYEQLWKEFKDKYSGGDVFSKKIDFLINNSDQGTFENIRNLYDDQFDDSLKLFIKNQENATRIFNDNHRADEDRIKDLIAIFGNLCRTAQYLSDSSEKILGALIDHLPKT